MLTSLEPRASGDGGDMAASVEREAALGAMDAELIAELHISGQAARAETEAQKRENGFLKERVLALEVRKHRTHGREKRAGNRYV